MPVCRTCGRPPKSKRRAASVGRLLEQAQDEIRDLRERMLNARLGALRDAQLLLERHGHVEAAAIVSGMRGRALEYGGDRP